MNSKNHWLNWRDFSAIRVTSSTLGVLVGLAGIEHGFLELLQGNVTPESIWIDAIGPEQRIWEYASETAISVIPNYFWTGIFAMIFGVFVTIWALVFIEKKYGAKILFLLSIILWLVGGGYGPIFLAIFATITATRINKPLTWWERHLSDRVRKFLVKLWPWVIPALVIIFWMGVEIAIVGYPLLWVLDADLTYGVQWICGITSIALMFVAILSAIAYDLQQKST